MNSIIKDKYVEIRKQHRCWACCKFFPIGTKMRYVAYPDEGTVYSTYYCDKCDRFIQQLPYEDTQEIYEGECLNYEEYKDFI